MASTVDYGDHTNNNYSIVHEIPCTMEP